MDVVGARRRQPPQAALFEARAPAADRWLAAEARGDRLFQQPAVPAGDGRAPVIEAARQGRCRSVAAVEAAQRRARSGVRRRASPRRALAPAAGLVAVRRRFGDIAEARTRGLAARDLLDDIKRSPLRLVVEAADIFAHQRE